MKPENVNRVPPGTPHEPFDAWRSVADTGGRWNLAEVGVVLQLKRLDPVGRSGTTYRALFSALGRVRLRSVLNPGAFADRSTYLKVQVADFQDSAEENAEGFQNLKDEGRVLELLREVVTLQRTKLEEAAAASNVKVHITVPEKLLDNLDARPGEGFWTVVSIWHTYLMALTRSMNFKFDPRALERAVQNLPPSAQEQLMKLNERLAKEGKIPSMRDFPKELRDELKKLSSLPELSALDRARLEAALPLQHMIQEDTHRERLRILENGLLAEKQFIIDGGGAPSVAGKRKTKTKSQKKKESDEEGEGDAASDSTTASDSGEEDADGEEGDAVDQGGISVLDALQQAAEDEEDLWKPFELRGDRKSKL